MDPYAEPEQTPPLRSHHGCLWGCLGVLIAAVVLVVAVFGFGAWHFYTIFGNDARIQTVMETVRKSDEAVSVLGRNIKVLEVETQTFDYATGRGGTATLVLKVAGSSGEGEVKADLDITGQTAKIKSLVLTDSEGRAHYLIGDPPPNPLMQNSI